MCGAPSSWPDRGACGLPRVCGGSAARRVSGHQDGDGADASLGDRRPPPAAGRGRRLPKGAPHLAGRMGGGGGSPTASSSSDDDGDASWRAAIDCVAVGGFGYPSSNGAANATFGGGVAEDSNGLEQPPQDEGKAQTPGLKLYQIKVHIV